jgi:hypothetical protein
MFPERAACRANLQQASGLIKFYTGAAIFSKRENNTLAFLKDML